MRNQLVILLIALTGALGAICSCGDQVPHGPSLKSLASGTPASPSRAAAAKAEQAVLVHLKLSTGTFGSGAERRRISDLEDELTRAIPAAGVGEYDGNEIGQGEYTLYMYGPDARRLADVVRPIIVKVAASGSFMTIRAGPAGAPEAREELSRSVGPGSPPPEPAPSGAATLGAPGGAGPIGGPDVVVPKGFDAALLEILACPEDKTPVRLAGRRELDEINAKIREGALRQRDGTTRSKPAEALLVRQDGKVGYEIEHGVPVMLIERGIVLQPGVGFLER